MLNNVLNTVLKKIFILQNSSSENSSQMDVKKMSFSLNFQSNQVPTLSSLYVKKVPGWYYI